MGMQDTSEYNGSAMRRMAWCWTIAVLVIAATWRVMDKIHRPWWYVVMSVLVVMGAYLVSIFLWDWLCRFLRWVSRPIRGSSDEECENDPESE